MIPIRLAHIHLPIMPVVTKTLDDSLVLEEMEKLQSDSLRVWRIGVIGNHSHRLKEVLSGGYKSFLILLSQIQLPPGKREASAFFNFGCHCCIFLENRLHCHSFYLFNFY